MIFNEKINGSVHFFDWIVKNVKQKEQSEHRVLLELTNFLIILCISKTKTSTLISTLNETWKSSLRMSKRFFVSLVLSEIHRKIMKLGLLSLENKDSSLPRRSFQNIFPAHFKIKVRVHAFAFVYNFFPRIFLTNSWSCQKKKIKS